MSEIDVEAFMPPAEPAVADEAKPDDKPEGQPQTPEQKTVPLAALHEERALRKQLQAELRETQARLTKVDAIEEQVKAWRASQAKAEEPPEPEFVEDPKAYIDHKQAKSNERAEAELKALREGYERVAAQTQAQMFQQQLKSIEDAYADEHDDYYEALKFVRVQRHNDLEARGYDENQIRVKIIQDELELAAEALNKKLNPAEVAYKRAQAYGYAQKSADDSTPNDDDRQARVARAQSMGSANSNVDVEALMAAPDDVLDEVFRELKFGNKMK